MKKRLAHIAATFLLAAVIIGGFGHVAHAAGCITLDVRECVIDIGANVANIMLIVASWILSIAGFILNFSMNLTLHIKEFVDNTPAVFTVWKAIRDISGIFIIFTLLYAAFKMILSPLGVSGSADGLIKTVVMAGVLINFSFFITGFGIDVSNVISGQLYNAIAPTNNLARSNVATATQVTGLFSDGGISDIFMSALRITKFYNPETASIVDPSGSGAIATGIQLILTGFAGAMMMITSAMSFFAISIAIIARFVILIFLLAFSPIIFASFAIPHKGVDSYASDFKSLYFGQLIFLPAYLLLMYFALSVLSTSNLFKSVFDSYASYGESWYMGFLIMGVNVAIVIFMLNIPLVAALALGAKLPKKLGESIDARKVWAWAGAGVGRNTAGRLAYSASNSDTMKNALASRNMLVRGIAGVTDAQLGKLGNYSFGEKKKGGGYKDKVEAQAKAHAAIHKKITTVDKNRYDQSTEEGRKALEDAKKEAEKRGKAYRDTLNNTLFSSVLKKSVDIANKKIWDATHAAAEAMEYAKTEYGVKGMDKTTEVMIKGAEGITQAISATPSAVGANLAGRKAAAIIDKKNKEEAKREAGEEAQKKIDEMGKELRTFEAEQDAEISRLRKKVQENAELIARSEEEYKQKLGQISNEKNYQNKSNLIFRPVGSTHSEEASVIQLETAIAKMKEEKLQAEKRMGELREEVLARRKEFARAEAELEKRVREAKRIVDQETSQKILSDIKETVKEAGKKDGE